MAHGELRFKISGPGDKNSAPQLFPSRMIMTTKRENIEVNGRTITVSNLDKLLNPAGNFTKANRACLIHTRFHYNLDAVIFVVFECHVSL
jgi:hypothetical protein